MKPDQFQEDLFHLIAFMITSARGLYDEPADYGVFRLIDSAGRLLEMLNHHDLLKDSFLIEMIEKIQAEREGSMDNERQRRQLDEWILAFSEEMRKRLE